MGGPAMALVLISRPIPAAQRPFASLAPCCINVVYPLTITALPLIPQVCDFQVRRQSFSLHTLSVFDTTFSTALRHNHALFANI